MKPRPLKMPHRIHFRQVSVGIEIITLACFSEKSDRAVKGDNLNTKY
jgi:hypothetical protein